MQKTSITFGILLAILSHFFSSLDDIAMKWLTGDYSPMQIIFFRSFFALLIIFGIVFSRNSLYELKTYRPHIHFVRTFYSFATTIFCLLGIKLIPIADFTAITYTVPFFVLLLSWKLLGEQVSTRLILATCIGFCGILFVVSPGSSAFGIGGFYVLLATLTSSLMIIQTRMMAWTESSMSITFWISTFCMGITICFLPFNWTTPGLFDLMIFFLLGTVSFLMQFLLAEALKHAPASVVMPFDYSTFVWAVLFGYLIWGDIPTEIMIVGTTIIILSGLYIAYNEQEQSGEILNKSFLKKLFSKKSRKKA